MANICYRFILVFFSIACLILTAFAITGSYENKSYLTPTYLINFHLNKLDLRQIISPSIGDNSSKRKRAGDDNDSTPTTTSTGSIPSNAQQWINVASSIAGNLPSDFSSIASAVGTNLPSSVPSDLASVLPSSLPTGDVESTISAAIANLLNNVSPEELGIADVYSVSYWGYCRGDLKSNKSSVFDGDLGRLVDENFDNSNVDYTWCSPPKAGYFFNPATVIREELNRTIEGQQIDSQSSLINELSSQYVDDLKVLVNNIADEYLNLPSDLQNNLGTLNNITKASFAMMIIAAVFSFISIVFQIMAMCLSPDNCCLSFLNFALQLVTFLASILAAGLATGAYVFVRRKVNDETGDYGIKSFLSINFYAFAWSAAVAAFLVVVFSAVGHCCGCFSGERRRYRQVAAYEHKGEY
ncbi:SUR7/PalI family protein [Candida parapsilosis]|uniref:SUR7/PalI family protein n=1 Tax=Candida parapsilosis TaxID=5480 RepID=A0A8X7TBE1_CANPA|nr:SUR7/PalI family protein [Candida parapsilosis]KAF6053942.1 SUR7/PalI family protein [Candida parapsilosis]